jgi:hypothetical protein
LSAPAGRADDFAWPRREVGREQAKGEVPVASASPDGGTTPVMATPPPPKPKKLRPIQPAAAPSIGDFFGLGASPSQRPRAAPQQQPPRPPGSVGRAASAPNFFTR